MSGVSSYIVLNNVTVNKYRSTYIDGGIKNMLKLGLFICHQCLNLIRSNKFWCWFFIL
jgi:hypothetical protein